MTKPDSESSYSCIGTIVSIDGPNRTIAIRLPNGQIVELVVALGCRVILNGEEVRLRLLLVGDVVNAVFVKNGDLFKATRINVLKIDKLAPGEQRKRTFPRLFSDDRQALPGARRGNCLG